jgi:hypothetical protein
MDVVPSPPLPPPPGSPPGAVPSSPAPTPQRRRGGATLAIVAGVAVVSVIFASAVAIGQSHPSTAARAGTTPSVAATTGADAPLPERLGGLPRIRSGPMLRQIEASAPTLPIAGATYDLALYGSNGQPSSMLMVIHGLGDVLGTLPTDVFFQTVGDGLAAGMTKADGQGLTVDFAAGAQGSVRGADHDCVPIRKGAATRGVICLFRASGVIGALVLFAETDPRAALKLSEEAATDLS